MAGPANARQTQAASIGVRTVGLPALDIEREFRHCEQRGFAAVHALREMAMNETAPRATFRSMADGTAEDWAVIGPQFFGYSATLPDRVLDHLRLLDGDY